MKIALANVAIILCTIGLSLGSAASIAEVNRPRTGIALIISIVAYIIAIISMGLAWYWAAIIAIPSAIFAPMLIAEAISGTHSQWSLDNMCRFGAEGYSEFKIMTWVLFGLVLSIISIVI